MPLGWDNYLVPVGSQAETLPLMICGYRLPLGRCSLIRVWYLYLIHRQRRARVLGLHGGEAVTAGWQGHAGRRRQGDSWYRGALGELGLRTVAELSCAARWTKCSSGLLMLGAGSGL